MRETAHRREVLQTIDRPFCSLLMTPHQISRLMDRNSEFAQNATYALDIIDQTAEDLVNSPYPDKAFELASYMIRDRRFHEVIARAFTMFLRRKYIEAINGHETKNFPE